MEKGTIVECTMCSDEGEVQKNFKQSYKKKRFTRHNAVCDECIEYAKQLD